MNWRFIIYIRIGLEIYSSLFKYCLLYNKPMRLRFEGDLDERTVSVIPTYIKKHKCLANCDCKLNQYITNDILD